MTQKSERSPVMSIHSAIRTEKYRANIYCFHTYTVVHEFFIYRYRAMNNQELFLFIWTRGSEQHKNVPSFSAHAIFGVEFCCTALIVFHFVWCARPAQNAIAEVRQKWTWKTSSKVRMLRFSCDTRSAISAAAKKTKFSFLWAFKWFIALTQVHLTLLYVRQKFVCGACDCVL